MARRKTKKEKKNFNYSTEKIGQDSINNKHNGSVADADVQERLSKLILASKEGSSLSIDECDGIVEAVLLESESGKSVNDIMIETLCDYLDEMTHDGAENILNQALKEENSEDGWEDYSDEDDEDLHVDNENYDSDSDSDPDGEEYIGSGECELCEREMKLTRHHLIPKHTWKHITSRFVSAAPFVEEGDMESAYRILDLGDDFQLPSTKTTRGTEEYLTGIFSSRVQIKLFLSSYCANLCRPCHSCVHGNIDHYELAERFNTVDSLLKNENIYKFCKWASKQKAGKYRC
eukprot:CAMPEP_0204645040 /NCGR_PEP_ID=MMETSP0718-20130828/1902_1 /ASSEMBLY_ACC=CAM_ASM_000674 /TAXON_ID=230516 /ORGANISM="Chaetoceros curvisetus" /LENGTH=289 /DNA_ID=CAMNT_0051666779 /DNA_START=105 /DNA_END=974 /DNA_ORIENTATION=-